MYVLYDPLRQRRLRIRQRQDILKSVPVADRLQVVFDGLCRDRQPFLQNERRLPQRQGIPL